MFFGNKTKIVQVTDNETYERFVKEHEDLIYPFAPDVEDFKKSHPIDKFKNIALKIK